MKWIFVLLIVLSATGYASWRFYQKTAPQPDEIDKIEMALTGAKRILPPNANITFQDVNVKQAIFFWARYALAPRYLSWHIQQQYDTVLTVSDFSHADSIRSVMANRKTMWEYRDSTYYYLLTSSH